jgi:LuxR family transcriptional regulator, quorum-sensing system regulator SdiA
MKIETLIQNSFEENSQSSFSENPDENRFELLTKREKEIIRLIADGNTSMDISTILFISIHTVNNHRKNIYKKLGTKNLACLVKYAIHFDLA